LKKGSAIKQESTKGQRKCEKRPPNSLALGKRKGKQEGKARKTGTRGNPDSEKVREGKRTSRGRRIGKKKKRKQDSGVKKQKKTQSEMGGKPSKTKKGLKTRTPWETAKWGKENKGLNHQPVAQRLKAPPPLGGRRL